MCKAQSKVSVIVQSIQLKQQQKTTAKNMVLRAGRCIRRKQVEFSLPSVKQTTVFTFGLENLSILTGENSPAYPTSDTECTELHSAVGISVMYVVFGDIVKINGFKERVH